VRFVLLAGTPEADTYASDVRQQSFLALYWLSFTMVWIGDALLIYRCFIIWKKRWSIIAVPLLLYFTNIALNIVIAVNWTTRVGPATKQIKMLHKFPLPLSFAQVVTTTTLICYRLIRHHRASRASGIQPSNNRLSLFHVVRIMLESAAIYAILLFVAIIIQFVHPMALWVISGMKVPIIGIAFTLLTIRLHIVTTRVREARSTLFTVSPWVNNVDTSQSVSGIHVLTTVEVKSQTDRAPANETQ